jgi:hypothetical protein
MRHIARSHSRNLPAGVKQHDGKILALGAGEKGRSEMAKAIGILLVSTFLLNGCLAKDAHSEVAAKEAVNIFQAETN